MGFRFTIALVAAKFLIWFLRFFGSGGTTLPGKLAGKMCPGILPMLSKNTKIIIITGTNGKTTVGRIVSRILEMNNIPHIQNRSGANLASGITTTFIESSDIRGTITCKTAVIEMDEAAFRHTAPLLQPGIIVITNFFRDQLDRYGELYSTVGNVKSGVMECPEAILVINADDSLSVSVGRDTENRTFYYGIEIHSRNDVVDIAGSDAVFCIYCQTKYEYLSRTYGHLGHFKCPGCGYERPVPSIVCTHIEELSVSGSQASIQFGNISGQGDSSGETGEYNVHINLPGLYNIYNALSAAACGAALNLPEPETIRALETFECGFGRMETIEHDNRLIRMILVKNPTGFNQVIEYLLAEKKKMIIAFLINDNLADGTDISWLWDVNFEMLRDIQDSVITFYTGGSRAGDMAVRLKYAGMRTDRISIEKDCSRLVEKSLSMLSEGETLFILPTYTAMLEIRKELKSKFKLVEFWK